MCGQVPQHIIHGDYVANEAAIFTCSHVDRIGRMVLYLRDHIYCFKSWHWHEFSGFAHIVFAAVLMSAVQLCYITLCYESYLC